MSAIPTTVNTIGAALQCRSTVNVHKSSFTNHKTANNSATCTPQGHGWDHLVPRVEVDSAFAKSVAEDAAFIPDKLLVDLNDAPPVNDAEAWRVWTSQSTEFDSVAAQVTEQRTGLYRNIPIWREWISEESEEIFDGARGRT